MERPVPAVVIRRCLIAFTALLLPAAAGAQFMPLQDDPAWGPRLRVTPFVGWATGVTREEQWRFQYGDGSVEHYDAELELAGGPMAGLTIEYGVKGPFSVLAGGAYLQRDDAVFTIRGQSDPAYFTSSSSILARLGASLQLREQVSDMSLRRLAASVFAAPFIQLEMPDDIPEFADTDLFDNATHFGLNFGVTGELPFATDRLALQVGFEDYFTWWSKDALARLPRYLGDDGTPPALTAAEASTDPSHQWVIRAGLSFRF